MVPGVGVEGQRNLFSTWAHQILEPGKGIISAARPGRPVYRAERREVRQTFFRFGNDVEAVKFAEQLHFGKIGEGRIAQWLMARGHSVLPVYEKELHTGKGPVLYSTSAQLIAPDMLCYRGQDVKWVEAKTKSSFTWHRLSQRWVTGIDLRHYQDYLTVAASSPWAIWLLFLHLDSRGAKDTPPELIGKSPVGLFGNDLALLSRCENHRHENWGNSGMVYWAHDVLRLLADIDEIPR